MSAFDIEFAAVTDIGKIREKNEDSVLISSDLGLGVVADGMGGHSAGEIASNIAVHVLDTTAQASEIYKMMGTTLTGVMFDGDNATAVHVGDSRIYLFRDGKLVQVTTDHSLAMEHVRRGLLTKAEADKSKIQNVLTRAMGIKKNVEFDLLRFPVKLGDVMVLCSDGLYKGMNETQLAEQLEQGKNLPLVKLCKQLVRVSNDNDGQDNISAVMIKILPPQRLTFKQKVRRFFGCY